MQCRLPNPLPLLHSSNISRISRNGERQAMIIACDQSYLRLKALVAEPGCAASRRARLHPYSARIKTFVCSLICCMMLASMSWDTRCMVTAVSAICSCSRLKYCAAAGPAYITRLPCFILLPGNVLRYRSSSAT